MDKQTGKHSTDINRCKKIWIDIQTDTQVMLKHRERQDERTNRLIGIKNTRTKLGTDRQTD